MPTPQRTAGPGGLRRVARIIRDVLFVNRALLTDRSARHRILTAAKPPSRRSTPAPPPTPPRAAATPYDGLNQRSTMLSGLHFDDRPPCLNLVLRELDPRAVYAGVMTAFTVATGLAEELGLPVRLVVLDVARVAPDAADQMAALTADGIRFAEVVTHAELAEARFGVHDCWLATHWVTAHALDVACRLGELDSASVVYLIQDFEPGFTPWSTDHALASATYNAGFLPVVNSTPLASYLRVHAPGLGAIDHIFRPAFELPELAAARERRRPSEAVRLFYYARPSRPRNAFRLGVAALRDAAGRLSRSGIPMTAVMAGEPGPDIDLGPTVLRNLGLLTRPEYFGLLSEIDLGLALQLSPHPGHTTFDLALSGAHAVTNEFAGTRAGLHPRITAVDADVTALSTALVEQALAPTPSVGPETTADLGAPLESVLSGVAAELRARVG